MTTKQEKLAAARKKLKEFQGKNRIVSNSKETFVSEIQASNLSEESSGSCSATCDDGKYVTSNLKYETENCIENTFMNLNVSKPLDGNKSENLGKLENHDLNNPTSCITSNFNLPLANNKMERELVSSQNKSSTFGNISPLNEFNLPVDNISHNPCEHIRKQSSDFHTNIHNNSIDDAVIPLQTELENHAQTINILIQQRNEAQNALCQAQNMLTEKADEIIQHKHQIMSLTTTINDLNKKIIDLDSVVTHLQSQNERGTVKLNEVQSSLDWLQSQLDSKKEENVELKMKCEEKNKEFQHLLCKFNEAQNQLSLYQIQPYSEEKSALTVKFSGLEYENQNLKHQIHCLEKQHEIYISEKEQANQNLKAYAEQCNSQLSALNSEFKKLTTENEELKQMNNMLSMNFTEIEDSKVQDESLCNYKTEIADLHDQINELKTTNEELEKKCQNLEEKIIYVEEEYGKRGTELQNLDSLLKKAESENKRLLSESETPNINEKLLAAMESDKVAAAKAVSQNQLLKNQIVELEEAFVKLNEEKLNLMDALSHEKHINKEMKSHLKASNFNTQDQNHHHGFECGDEISSSSIVTESHEIEELRCIIRQLQDDKMELKARLNSQLADNKESTIPEKRTSDISKNNENPIDTKLLLQQMEEKVTKTMNELAVLDEEKEKLEHLVLQLQGETETIGDYITLYRKQRMLLKQKAQEKDVQLIQLSKDKEELKSKLMALDELVQNLLKEKNNSNINTNETIISALNESTSDDTADKIRALISEIGSADLINSDSVAFKHCACCSGRLITV